MRSSQGKKFFIFDLTTLRELSKFYSSPVTPAVGTYAPMLTSRTALTRRVLAALDSSPSRIPVLLGGCGSGRTTLLHQLRERIGRMAAQYVDVERTATTPERWLRAIATQSPFPAVDSAPQGAHAAFDATMARFHRARPSSGEPATFLLDEFLELRTFESFPGLRRVLYDFADGLADSPNRFVLTSRYSARTLRLLRDRSSRFEVIHITPFTVEETLDILGPSAGADAHDADELARTVHALGDGRPAYTGAIADELVAVREQSAPGGSDAISALAALMGPGGRLATMCHFSYELRLHRARGYGALKAILDILAEDEGLTLTEISQRLQRTPGSTKDYLSWLEDVDLVTARQKRYSFSDPLVRLWVRLYCRATAPNEDDLAREIHRFALPRLPQPVEATPAAAPAAAPAPEPAYAMVSAGGSSGIIEID
jgi:hypothetical protein